MNGRRTKTVLRTLARPLRSTLEHWRLPRQARLEASRDSSGLPAEDPGIERAVLETIAWLCAAQDHSRSRDGGVARHYSLLDGWSTSYPETTGYIIPTLLEYANLAGMQELKQRAERMLDWLVSIQLPCGAFQGGRVDMKPVVPVTFNTGQVLLGLARGAAELDGKYLEPMRKAANWLVDTQDDDGSWKNNHSPFAAPGEKAHDTHIAWGLLEAGRVDHDERYAKAALANARWAMGLQDPDGWFHNCCLSDPSRPLTHTVGYALRGILEAYRSSGDPAFLLSARRTGDSLLLCLGQDGFLPGCLRRDWTGDVAWACLTGTCQIAACWLLLHEFTGDSRYRDAAARANRFVRRTVRVEGSPEVRGAVKGSFPIHGEYCSYQFPDWAAKFFVDSNLLELQARRGTPVSALT